MLGPQAPPEVQQELRAELALDQPIYVQYYQWLSDIAMGNFGESLHTGLPVTKTIANVAEPTLSIAMLALVFALIIGIPGGIISAVRRYRIEDHVATIGSFFGISMPGFWIGILLVLVFTDVKMLPTFGYTPIEEGIGEWFRHILLPAIAAGYPFGAIIMRLTRSSMLEVQNQDYIRTARAKGLDPKVIVLKHGLQNALLPVVTMVGILFAVLLSGVVAVEIVFGIRGLGRVLIESLTRRDFPVIQGAVIIISVIFVLMNVIVDIVYTFINPKIKYGGNSA
jgi:peptide/nickel transport system permease protein